jgi:hypothetical protein
VSNNTKKSTTKAAMCSAAATMLTPQKPCCAPANLPLINAPIVEDTRLLVLFCRTEIIPVVLLAYMRCSRCSCWQQLQHLSQHGPAALLLLLSLAKMQNACPGANPCISSSTLAEQSAALPVTGAGSILVRLQPGCNLQRRCSSEHLNIQSKNACNGTVLAV